MAIKLLHIVYAALHMICICNILFKKCLNCILQITFHTLKNKIHKKHYQSLMFLLLVVAALFYIHESPSPNFPKASSQETCLPQTKPYPFVTLPLHSSPRFPFPASELFVLSLICLNH